MYAKELDPTSSPLAAFGVQLRRFRHEKGLTQNDLGALIHYTGALVSYVERAERPPSVTFATRADEVLETGGTLTLMYWHLKHTALIEGFPEFASHEATANELRLFEIGVIPGLLQVAAYASADLAGFVARGSITQDQADERLGFRLARQHLLERDPAPGIHVVLDESAIRQAIGGPTVMAEQLGHLEELAQSPSMTIQVAPFSLGERRPFTSAVTLLTLPDHTLMGYTETLQRGFLERDRETVAGWRRSYDLLQVEALSQADSLAMIRAVRKELLNMTPKDLIGVSWLKSSYSSGGGQCIEVAPGFPGVMPVRDSKDPEGPALVFGAEAWSAFVAGVKAGEFGSV